MPGKVFDVLNEVVVDRGSNPYISKIECYEHDRLITKVGSLRITNFSMRQMEKMLKLEENGLLEFVKV